MVFESVQAGGPRAGPRLDPPVELSKRLRLDPVDALAALWPARDDAGLSQYAEVLGNRRLAERKLLCELAREPVTTRQQLEDPTPGRVRKCLEDLH